MRTRYGILGTILCGAFAGNMEAVMPNAALSRILIALHATVAGGTWILTIYTLLFAVAMPAFGTAGDRIGHERLYLWSLIAFSITMLFSGLSRTLMELILWRALAGISIAPSLPAAMAIVSKHFSAKERGKAMGVLGMAIAASTAIGVPIGGIIAQYAGWPAVFYAGILAALTGIVLSLIVLPDGERRKASGRFDFFGMVYFTAGSICLMFILATGSTNDWRTPAGWTILLCAVGCGLAFVVAERRSAEPFLPLRLFRAVPFVAISLVRALQMAVLYGVLFLLPLYWEQARHEAASSAGMGLLVLPLVIMIAAPVAGRLTDRWGSRTLVVIGMVATALGSCGLLVIFGGSGNPLMLASLVVLGTGFGFVQSASMTAVTLSLPQDSFGVGLGVFNMLTFVGGTMGLALFGSLTVSAGFRADYSVMMAAGLAGAILALASMRNGSIQTDQQKSRNQRQY